MKILISEDNDLKYERLLSSLKFIDEDIKDI